MVSIFKILCFYIIFEIIQFIKKAFIIFFPVERILKKEFCRKNCEFFIFSLIEVIEISNYLIYFRELVCQIDPSALHAKYNFSKNLTTLNTSMTLKKLKILPKVCCKK